MATKKLAQAELEAFARMFAAWVRDKHDDNQTHAGRALGISQSHVSALLSGDRGPGLPMLIKLRSLSPYTMDEWMGLPPKRVRVSGESQPLTREDMRELFREEFTNAGASPPLLRQDPATEGAGVPRRKQRA